MIEPNRNFSFQVLRAKSIEDARRVFSTCTTAIERQIRAGFRPSDQSAREIAAQEIEWIITELAGLYRVAALDDAGLPAATCQSDRILGSGIHPRAWLAYFANVNTEIPVCPPKPIKQRKQVRRKPPATDTPETPVELKEA